MDNFIAPHQIGFNYKRIPRKTKKKYKILLNKYSFLTLNEKMWYILGETNKEYRNFLIKEICKS